MMCSPGACGRCVLANGCRPISLARMAPGERGTVLALELARPADARKLMALGVVPGASIELERRSPAIVFRTCYTELAVDEALAAGILVQRD